MKPYTALGALLWMSLAACQSSRQWQCSSQDTDGFVYYPDVPADERGTERAEVPTHELALYIFETVPDCNGKIIGADFCYHLMNTTDLQLKPVFKYVQLEEIKGDTFRAPANYTVHTASAIPLDRTQCVPRPQNTSYCCQRMTTRGERLTLVAGTKLVLGILTRNVDTYYPLLQFEAESRRYQVVAHLVDRERLTDKENVFNNTFCSLNTNRGPVSLPILRFVVEPDEVVAVQVCPDRAAVIGTLATLVALETATLAGCIAALTSVASCYKKEKNKRDFSRRKYATPTPVEPSEPPPSRNQGNKRGGYNKKLVPNIVYANRTEHEREAGSSRGSTQQVDISRDEYDYIDSESTQ